MRQGYSYEQQQSSDKETFAAWRMVAAMWRLRACAVYAGS